MQECSFSDEKIEIIVGAIYSHSDKSISADKRLSGLIASSSKIEGFGKFEGDLSALFFFIENCSKITLKSYCKIF